MIMISGAFGIKVHSFSSYKLMERNFGPESAEEICRLMWVPSSLNGPVNHVVPLLHMEVEERDEGLCSIQIDSQNACSNLFGDRRDSRTMTCKHCLRDYHAKCILATGGDENWSCHCFVKADTLTW